MRIAVAATPAVAIPTLDWLETSEHDLSLVITRPDRPAGRSRKIRESQVALWASAHSIPCLKPLQSDELVGALSEVDLVVTIGYGVILPTKILVLPQNGFVNLHFSLLPAWRGAAPVQRAILNGDEKFGLTIFALDEGMDTGPIYIRREIPTQLYENAGQCLERMAAFGPDIVRDVIGLIEAGIKPSPQSDVGLSYAAKISKADARIIWSGNSTQVERGIRAFTPEPGAWTIWRDEPLRITRARPYPNQATLEIGQVSIENGMVLVGCGGGDALVIEEVRPAGRKNMSAKSWFNGARAVPGECFV